MMFPSLFERLMPRDIQIRHQKIWIYKKMSYKINKRSLVLKVVSFIRTKLGIYPLLLDVLHTYAMDTFISPISYLPRIWDT